MKQQRSFLKDRIREKEDHLQQAFEREKEDKHKESTTIRASLYAAEAIEDLKYTKRYKSAMAALDEIVRIYELHKDDENQD